MDELTTDVSRLLEHLKIKPTYTTLNTIYITLKNHGYQDIPKVRFYDLCTIDKKIITNYCKEIEELIETEPDLEERKKNSSKEVHMFQESSMLPQNVYVSEKGDEEKLEDDYIDENVTSATESENSAGSEQEEQEEGYDVYEENNEEEYSD